MAEANDGIEELLRLLEKRHTPVAIGLDMAASEANWGICVLMLDESNSKAQLVFLSPRPAMTLRGVPSKNKILRPQLDQLRRILACLAKRQRPVSLAVDVPFGWPYEHGQFTDRWCAADAVISRPEWMPNRSGFQHRLCDHTLTKRYPQILPFAIGADTIGQAAFRWAEVRAELGTLVGSIDVGLDHVDQPIITFETYPGAFVKLVAGNSSKYKSQPVVRRSLLAELQRSYDLETDGPASDCIEWACCQKGSPDALDALLCAFSAWDHLRWRGDRGSIHLSIPANLLKCEPTEEEALRIRREGWILVRSR